MADNFNLKLDKIDEISVNDFNGGLKRELIKNKKLLAIFDCLDDGNKILDKKETQAFKYMLFKYAEDNNLSATEAGKLLKDLFRNKKSKDISEKDLFKFINAVVKVGKDVKNSQVAENDGDKVVQITYKDGTIEQINPVKNIKTVIQGKMTSVYVNSDNRLLSTEFIDEIGNVTRQTYNKKGNRLSQEKVIDGVTYKVEYDGNGNTKVIVQNREGFKKLVELFGVDKKELIELNKDKIHKHPKTGRRFFLVGDEILIPREIEADDPVLSGRKDREDAIQEWVDERNGKTPTPSPDPMPEPSPQPNPKPIIPAPPTPMPNPVPDPVITPEENEKQKKNKKAAEKIANKLYKICDDNSAAINKDVFWKELNKVNKNNIVAVLDSYDKIVEEKHTDSSLLDTICSEVGASSENRKKACNKVFETMTQAAKEAGVSEKEIAHARKEFNKSLEQEFGKIGRISTKDMEKCIDFMRGAIVNAKISKQYNIPEMTTKEAMKIFIEGEDGLLAMNDNVQKMYKDAREKEGWVAKTGDKICGLFGCDTIEEMDAKLGKYSKDVKQLVTAANAGDEAQFKKLYKKIFGIDFNPKAIAARSVARDNLEQATTYNESYKAFDELEKITKDMDYKALTKEMKEKLKFTDSDIEQLVTNYAQSKSMPISSESEKQIVLKDFIKTSKKQYKTEFEKFSQGKTIEQMQKDLELLTKSAYGTNDIVKDVMQFNENQLMTDMITSAGFEIAGTIALQFVPGLGQLATAKLAVNAANWGVKGAKLAKVANKASKVFGAVSKASTASKTAKIATQMATAGIATAAVNFSNKKDVKETLKKTLMNMSFAGVGATSSVLTPKLMQAFGCSNIVATEIAEEIINTAGAYGITKLSGSDYTTQDGFIDFASGIVMSRISHIKSTKSGIDSHINDPHFGEHQGGVHGNQGGESPKFDIDDVDITPDNPKKFEIFGEEVNVEHIETNSKGQKVLHTSDGIKITLNEKGNPIVVKNDEGVAHYTYDHNDELIKVEGKNKENKLVNIMKKQNDSWVESDYRAGKEYLLDSDKKTILTERYIKLSEYPANAVMPDPVTFTDNIIEQMEQCDNINDLLNLHIEVETYKTNNIGSLDGKLYNDIYNKYKIKEQQILKMTQTTPHKPLSKLVTDPSFENKFTKFTHLAKFGKKGLPLKYPHDKFISDLKQTIDALPASEKAAVMNDFNLEFVMNGGKYELKDIPNLNATAKTPSHQKVLDLLNKYAKENEVQLTYPSGMNEELNNILKDVPEFTFMIGKAQNGKHSYSLDIHTLRNMQLALKYADDINLGAEQKEILKMSILLHDIGKQFKGTSVSDTGHAALSKKYAEKILDRFNYTFEQKQTILNLIENHHWFKDYNKCIITSDDVVKMFGKDIEIAKIMAKADLESVSDTFHKQILDPGKNLTQYEYNMLMKQKMDAIGVSSELLNARELPIGDLEKYKPYHLDKSKVDRLILGGSVELDINDPQFKQLCDQLAEGESFAIGHPTTTYTDVKLKIGSYSDGVGSHHLIVKKVNGEIIIEAHKPVTIVKDIPTKVVSDPVLKAEIDKIKAKATKITTRTFKIDGKQVPFEVLDGPWGGSNHGFWVINKQTGEMFFAKKGGGQSKAEYLTAQLYKQAGCNVPEVSFFTDTDGAIGTLSKFEPKLKPVKDATPLVNDQFGMDVLTANWDAVVSDNTCITMDGKAMCIDLGGSLDFHAHQNTSKPFTAIPQELLSYFTHEQAPIYSKLTRHDLIKSLEKAVSLKDADIKILALNAGVPHYAEILIKRKKFLKTFIEELKKDPTPMPTSGDASKMHVYMQKKYASALEKMIDQAKSDADIDEVKQALGYLNHNQMCQNLTDKIDIKSKEIAGNKPKIKSLSEQQVINILTKFGFTKDFNGQYKVILPTAVKNELYNKYGAYYKTIIDNVEHKLSDIDITRIQLMMNGANGQFIDLYQNNMPVFLHLYHQIKESQIFYNLKDMNAGEWETIANLIKYPTPMNFAESINYYKGCGYYSINKALEKLKAQGISPTGHTKDCIDTMQSYISTQVIHTPITIKRNEGYEVFKSITLPNGKTLDVAMEEAFDIYEKSSYHDKSAILQLIDIVNMGDYTATQEHFMSATIAGEAPFEHKPVHWTMKVEKESKGVLLEGCKLDKSLEHETEILLQKDSNIKIISLNFDWAAKKWTPKGYVTN